MVSDNYTDVSVSNYMFVSSERTSYPTFVENNLRGVLMKVDFEFDIDNAREYINDFIANQTSGHFKELVPESLMDADTIILMVRFCIIRRFIYSTS